MRCQVPADPAVGQLAFDVAPADLVALQGNLQPVADPGEPDVGMLSWVLDTDPVYQANSRAGFAAAGVAGPSGFTCVGAPVCVPAPVFCVLSFVALAPPMPPGTLPVVGSPPGEGCLGGPRTPALPQRRPTVLARR